MPLSPKIIIQNLKDEKIDKFSAFKLLVSLIEESRNVKIRIESLEMLGNLGVKSEEVFQLLENYFLSDSSEEIRNIAALMLKKQFLEKAFVPIKWVFENDSSPKVLKTAYDSIIMHVKSLVRKNNHDSRSILIEEIRNMKEIKFRIGFETDSNIDQFSMNELADILINYFTSIYLEKTYWRVKYSINGNQIKELSFPLSGLNKFPEVIQYLTKLTKLTLRYTQLKEIPEWIGNLRHLELLNLNVNKIHFLPDSIGSLTMLKELTFWRNELISLPNSIGSLKLLKILNLRLNNIKYLPETIGDLNALEKLDLYDNKLEYLPQSICRLKNLKSLILNENLLKILPEHIGSLSSLEMLDVENNALTMIHDSIGNLKSLKYLNLSRNNLKVIPESLSKLTNLKELYIGGNNSLRIPKFMKDLENRGVKIYYFSY